MLSLGLSLSSITRRGAAAGAVATGPTTAALLSSLYGASEAGDVFDPSDMTRLWTDTAGTTAASAAGDTIRRIGGQRGTITLTNATGWTLSTSGGLWWLDASGASGFASTATVDFSGTDKAFVCAGVRKTLDNAGRVVELSSTTANNGVFSLGATFSGENGYRYEIRGTANGQYRTATGAPPATTVIAVNYDIGGATLADEIVVRENGAARALTVVTAGPGGTGNFGNYTLYVGARNSASLFFNGRLHGLIVRGALPDATQRADAEAWMNQRTGAY